MESVASQNVERTKACLASIKGHENPKARVILIVGKIGAGKSSITELITGVTGLAGNDTSSVTTECQIASTSVNDEKHFIIDTPGFDSSDTEWDTTSKIMSMVDEIRDHAVFVGVWYVVSNWDTRHGSFEKKLFRWLAAMCGESVFPRLTFVTTFWGTKDENELRAHQSRLSSRKSQDWAGFLQQGAHAHQFGKRYVYGMEAVETLSWYGDREELAAQAKRMVSQYCPVKPEGELRIVQELSSGMPLANTAAARVFLVDGPPRTTSEPESPQSSSANPKSSRPGEQDAQSRTSQSAEPAETGPSIWSEIARGIVNGVGELLLQGVQQRSGSIPLNLSFQSRGQTRWDTNSVVDQLKARNMPSDFGSRASLFQQSGMGGQYTGSERENNRLRQYISRTYGS